MNEWKNIQLQTRLKILLVGDSCIDEYKIGTVDRLSPEAPVPVIKLIDQFSVPGMAANVRLNLINLNIDVDFVTNDTQITKTRFIDKRSGQHLLRVDSDPLIQEWSGETNYSINEYDAIVISDYNKGFLSYNTIQTLICSTNKPVFIDTKKPNLNKFIGNNVWIKINESEYQNRLSLPTNLIVTLGDRGAMLKTADEEMIYPTKKVEVTDVCGCGDTFLAALTAQYLYTKDIEKAIIFANVAAGITVQHRGNYAPSYDEIRHAGY